MPDSSDKIHHFPIYGFKLRGALLEHGPNLCKNCPANIGSYSVAGCQGSFTVNPRCDETQEWLEERIQALEIGTELDALFQSTEPRWYGLWVDSPLSTQQRLALSRLFETENDEEFLHFRKALSSPYPLHVSQSPPSDADLGWYTVFGHCDRCKAPPDFKQSFDSEQICQVCGHSYRPRDNQRQEKLTAPTPIQKAIGSQSHRDFIRRWFLKKGLSDAQIAAVYNNYLDRNFQSISD